MDPDVDANTESVKIRGKKRKRTRRGKYKCKYSANSENSDFNKDKFVILHTNVQAVKNRKSSLKAIVNNLQVDLVTINETHLKGTDKLKPEGYKTYSKKDKMLRKEALQLQLRKILQAIP